MFEISGTDLVPEKQRLVKSIGGKYGCPVHHSVYLIYLFIIHQDS